LTVHPGNNKGGPVLNKEVMMKVIGLTGGIGSGKSTVSHYLAELGAVVIDADKVGHEALTRSDVKQEIVAAFGSEVLGPADEIDRKRLAERVFNNPKALDELNTIVHTRMRSMAKDRIERYRQQGAAVVLLEAPILIEAKGDWVSLVDEIWVIVAPEAAVLKRMKDQRGMTEAQVKARISAQLSNEERIKHAAVVINNDGDLGALKQEVKQLWEKLIDKSKE
jgi:dephospho-CoA kinase